MSLFTWQGCSNLVFLDEGVGQLPLEWLHEVKYNCSYSMSRKNTSNDGKKDESLLNESKTNSPHGTIKPSNLQMTE